MPALRPPPSWTRRARPLVAALVAAAAVLVPGDQPAAAAATPADRRESYVWPVDAAVVDGFRPPPTPYAAGNRGIDLDTRVGQPVMAAAGGVVLFAGAVGRSFHVVVLHADGLRTSYSFLHRVDVRRGDHVRQGDTIGLAGETLHFGLRDGAAYLDPRAVLGRRGPPRLVADAGGAPASRTHGVAARPFRRPSPPAGHGSLAPPHRLRRPLRAV
jgi:murein DD-endopeptidase MepM/ murein hydrolase activator NlpD